MFFILTAISLIFYISAGITIYRGQIGLGVLGLVLGIIVTFFMWEYYSKRNKKHLGCNTKRKGKSKWDLDCDCDCDGDGLDCGGADCDCS